MGDVLTRRDLFKLAGALVISNGVLHVNAEKAMAAGESDVKHPAQPWWVKEVDKPTTEIDWQNMQRFDEYKTTRGSFADYVGKDKNDQLTALQAANIKQNITDQKAGFKLRDYALNDSWLPGTLSKSFLGPQKTLTPQQRGVPKWTGTPEEAAEMIRAALRHMGAASVGFVQLEEGTTRKLIYAHDPAPDKKELLFQNTDTPSETATQRIIPYMAEWAIVYTVQMSGETLRSAPSETACQTTLLTYARANAIQSQLQEFLRGLGYMGLGEATINALAISPALGVLAGLGEMSRTNRMISPEYGTMVRVFKVLTDLPLATDKPINAGIMQFCKSCKKCATACPSGALSMETEPTWQVAGPWSNPGHKAWFEDSTKCMTFWRQNTNNCTSCFAACPFAKNDQALMHSMVKAAIAGTPSLDAMIKSMDDALGYGKPTDPEEWWTLDLPEYGIDSNRGHVDRV